MIIIYISLFGCILSQSFPFSARYLSGETQILQKGQKQTVAASEYFFIFNSGDFKDGEEMYFKIKAEHFLHFYIYYEFTDSDHTPIVYNTLQLKKIKANSKEQGVICYIYIFW